jgi:hypothetical protein
MIKIVPDMADIKNGGQDNKNDHQEKEDPPLYVFNMDDQVKDEHQESSGKSSDSGNGFEQKQEPDEPDDQYSIPRRPVAGIGNFYSGEEEPGQKDERKDDLEGIADMGDQDDFAEVVNMEKVAENKSDQSQQRGCEYGK